MVHQDKASLRHYAFNNHQITWIREWNL